VEVDLHMLAVSALQTSDRPITLTFKRPHPDDSLSGGSAVTVTATSSTSSTSTSTSTSTSRPGTTGPWSQRLHVSVPRTVELVEEDSGKSYTAYEIQVTAAHGAWVVHKRWVPLPYRL
jgi:hypothetical protein